MTISEFINEMDILYPRSHSAPWDTDGLQCCADPTRPLRKVLVALDAGKREIEYAVSGGYDLLLTHHPMIFGNTGYIVPDTLYGGRVIKLICAGVSAASFHTRLDAGVGGVNDCLASILGLENTVPFGDADAPSIGRIGEFGSYMTADELSLYIKERLQAPSLRITGNGRIKKLAVLGGAGKDYIIPAHLAGADAILTGEVSYNAALDLSESGITVIEGGHYYTEFPVCRRLSELVFDIAGVRADIYKSETQKYY